jgi:ABC-2 type transport system permease protein
MKHYGLVRKTVRDVRVAAISVALVMFLIALLDILIYPQYQETLKDADFGPAFESFFGEAGSFASPAGFLSAEFFSWMPLLLITVAIIGGTGATAGEEGAGTLDLLLAQPVSRRRVLLEKAAGLALALTFAALWALPGFVIAVAFVDFDLSFGRFFAATINMLPLTFLFLALAFWAGAALPSRSAAAVVCIGAVVVTYFLNTIGAAVDVLEIPRKFSPFYWADGSHVLVGGFDWLRTLGLLLVTAVFTALALWSFDRRDIAGGGAEWSWRHLLHRPTPPAFPPHELEPEA